ncbi:2,3-bisphosphoglycerate-dependent phosphoglycerate mutase [Ochrobactrum sp. RH2CCR150]|nr:2,3-bisphosphoglycerate-dependent phosphoglycerate mutase [Ochrobactrum sp. RH2CCR150]
MPLTAAGRHEASRIALALQAAKYTINRVFCSHLRRAIESAEIIVETLGKHLPVSSNDALNERDYGELTGMNKIEAANRFGEEQVHQWRRSYEMSPPGGESLKDTKERVLPYYLDTILPGLERGENILIVAHGNSLRALIMYLEKLTPSQIITLELKTGEIVLYQIDENGNATRLPAITATI